VEQGRLTLDKKLKPSILSMKLKFVWIVI